MFKKSLLQIINIFYKITIYALVHATTKLTTFTLVHFYIIKSYVARFKNHDQGLSLITCYMTSSSYSKMLNLRSIFYDLITSSICSVYCKYEQHLPDLNSL